MRRFAALAALGLCSAVIAEERLVHVVQPGESLSRIAAKRLGDLACWPEIYRANRDQIKDPSLVYPGQELVVPNAAACASREPGRAAEG